MGDYIDRLAALNVNFKIPTRFCESKLTTARKAVQEYANEIAKIPAADVEPVVRCRDCKNYIELSGACAYLVVGMHEDDFCSYGKKREEI